MMHQYENIYLKKLTNAIRVLIYEIFKEYFDEKIFKKKKIKSMFGNCFFPLFYVFKNNFLFLRLKNLFGKSKWAENKNCFQNSICEGK